MNRLRLETTTLLSGSCLFLFKNVCSFRQVGFYKIVHQKNICEFNTDENLELFGIEQNIIRRLNKI